jgi:hypothetical protein
LTLVAVFAGAAGSAPDRANEMPTPRQGPTVTGTVQEGETLTAHNGQWLYSNGLGCGSECRYSYQWQRCDPSAVNCANIPGQTQREYVLVTADVGNKIRVVNTLTKYDCDALNQNCKDVTSNQESAPSELVKAKPVTIAAPSVVQPPAITGTAMEEETLTASTGQWNGQQPISMRFQWQRCDVNGGNCGPIPNANAQTYKLVTADVGATIRVEGIATNAGGTASATSAQTPVVAAFGPTAQRRSISVERVSLPHRLIIDRIAFTPKRLTSRDPFTVRIRVSDTRGFRIEGALVQVISVPFGQILAVPEAETDRSGFVTFRLTPTRRMPLERGSLVLFLRARKPGENPLAGVSTRRLTRVLIAPAPVAVPAPAPTP